MVNSFTETLGARGLSIEQQKEIAYIQSQAGTRERSRHDNRGETALYVGELDPLVDEATLMKHFYNLQSAHVCRDSITRKSLGYAYINFHSPEDCANCLKTMNYTLIGSSRCRLMYSERNPTKRYAEFGNIFVKNLPPNVEEKTIHDTFSQWGNVTSCRLLRNSLGQFKGSAYVSYDNIHAAERAIKATNGTTLFGRELTVGHQIPKSTKEIADETSNKQKFTNLYVKNINTAVTEDVLRDTFSQYGHVSSLLIQKDEYGTSKGFGFVNFESPDDAETALQSLHDMDYYGKKLFVSKAQKKSEREDELRRQHEQVKSVNKYQRVNLYVKNLGDEVTDEQLKGMFSPYGTITSAKVMKDDTTGQSKGFGFVCFTSSEDASLAVQEMNGRLLSNKNIYVALAQRKEDRRTFLESQLPQKTASINPVYNMTATSPVSTSPSSRHASTVSPPPLSPPTSQPASTQVAAENTEQEKPLPVLNQASLEMFSIQTQRQMLGERIYTLVSEKYPNEAGKVTGILLDLDKNQVIHLVNHPKVLETKASEVVTALNRRKQ
ncbi:hypothetical protein BDB01DRAFT_848563 [Pilobolus umbonatus]|nr:hypothetical protein BDB01DRAFT_848563 [Pilobolus umbonatus]